MRRRFIVSLTLLFVLFGVGSGVGLVELRRSSEELNSLVEMFAVEDMRRDLQRQLGLAEQSLEVSGTVFADNSDELIATVRELERQMFACTDCHHEGESLQLIDLGIDLVGKYKSKFSVFFTAIGDDPWRERLQIEVAAIGRELETTVGSIRHLATAQLSEHISAARARVGRSRAVLTTTVTASFLTALLLAAGFMRRATEPVNKLIDAAALIAEGQAGVQIEHREIGRLGVLLEEFNEMSLALWTQARQVERQAVEVRKTRDAALLTLARLAESRDNETGCHLNRISAYSREIALALARSPYADRIDERFVEQLAKSSPLHDIGKVGIRDSILLKAGPLTREQEEEMRRHTFIGGDTLRSVIGTEADGHFLRMAMEIAYCHHEQWDGAGYPRSLAGEKIPLSARIVALADAYDCITSVRVYKPAYSHGEAIRRIIADRAHHFDPVVVDAFLLCHERLDEIRRSTETELSEHDQEDRSESGILIDFRSDRSTTEG